MLDVLPSKGAPPELERLSELARSIERRSRDTEYQPAVEWCESLLAAIEGLSMGVDRNASMHLLRHAALSLHQRYASGFASGCWRFARGACGRVPTTSA